MKVVLSEPTHFDLMWWARHEWRDSVQLETLAPLDRPEVRTRNSLYEITILSPMTGDVRLRGGRFFPETAPATLAGCSLGGSFLKVRAISPGFSMELLRDNQPIITTWVQSITHVREPVPVH